ncbi:hypothetical protein EV192_105746 [Actinocrispum wychmicini]|uniref:SecDF P1 head subdomain domain-containing protein n=2 Tax=Actinocrispum wychmicini TaxID=1213861 RepID=A0A4R2JX01_9PSEU|nr:hypothetical protein EV192_105746 [Actinocrispum wychmicini]
MAAAIAGCQHTETGQPVAASGVSSAARTPTPGTKALTIRSVIEEQPVPSSPSTVPSTVPSAPVASDADIAAAKQTRQNVGLTSDPQARQQAFASLDCSLPDPLMGHEDTNLPLVACGSGSKYVLDKAMLTGKDVADAFVGKSSDGHTPVVSLSLTDAATSVWADFTAANVGKQAAFVVGTSVVSAPMIQAPIPGGRVEVSGSFTEADARDIVRRITGR